MGHMSIIIDIFQYVEYNGHIDKDHALIALSALSQETRLEAFRILIEYGSEGLPAGQLGERLGVPHNTLSFHLSHLSHAGLVTARKEGRSIIYSADCDGAERLVNFLITNCCARSQDPRDCTPNFTERLQEVKQSQAKPQ